MADVLGSNRYHAVWESDTVTIYDVKDWSVPINRLKALDDQLCDSPEKFAGMVSIENDRNLFPASILHGTYLLFVTGCMGQVQVSGHRKQEQTLRGFQAHFLRRDGVLFHLVRRQRRKCSRLR